MKKRIADIKITAAQIAEWMPCDRSDNGGYNYPFELTKGKWAGWTGTVGELLDVEDIPVEDKFWVVLKPELIGENTCHELACKFAEHVLPIWERKYPEDMRPRKAVEAKRAWMRGEINDEELAAAWDAARDAAWDAWAAAWDAGAARDAAWDAARAARAAAWDARAAGAAAWDARAARDAAWDAETKWQIETVKSVKDEG